MKFPTKKLSDAYVYLPRSETMGFATMPVYYNLSNMQFFEPGFTPGGINICAH